METYVYVIESEYSANPEVLLFATKEEIQERFVKDILEDNDRTLDHQDYDNSEDVERLKFLQEKGAPLDERFDLAQEVYERISERGERPYYHGHTSGAVEVPEPPPTPEDPLLPIPHSNYDGVRCPLCKAEHTMEGGNLTATDNGAEYEMECNECGATWSEQLDVTGYTYLCDKEGNEIKIPE